MTNYDLRLDVPALAYINAQLMDLLEKGGTLWDAKKRLFAQQPYAEQGMNAYDYRVSNQSLAISLLFCTIVVPREFLKLPENHTIYRVFDTEGATGLFNIQKPKPIDAYRFIRLLRNSLTHGLFSITITESGAKYEFWTDRPPDFKASIDHDGLMRFISVVGMPLANAVLKEKSGGAQTT